MNKDEPINHGGINIDHIGQNRKKDKQEEGIKNVSLTVFRFYRKHPFIILLVILLWVAWGYFVYNNDEFSAGISYFLPLLFIFIFHFFIKTIFHAKFMKHFALENGFTYEKKGNRAELKSNFLQITDSDVIRNVIRGSFNNHPFVLFSAQMRSKKNRFWVTAIKMELDATLPDLIVKSKKDYMLPTGYDFVAYHVEEVNIIELEGEFSEHFQVLATKEYEIEALQILTPDFMEKLIPYSNSFSFEIAKNELYAFGNIIYSTEKMNRLFEFADMLAINIKKKAVRMA